MFAAATSVVHRLQKHHPFRVSGLGSQPSARTPALKSCCSARFAGLPQKLLTRHRRHVPAARSVARSTDRPPACPPARSLDALRPLARELNQLDFLHESIANSALKDRTVSFRLRTVCLVGGLLGHSQILPADMLSTQKHTETPW